MYYSYESIQKLVFCFMAASSEMFFSAISCRDIPQFIV